MLKEKQVQREYDNFYKKDSYEKASELTHLHSSLFNETYLGERSSIYEKHVICGEFRERYEYYPPLKHLRKVANNTARIKTKGKERKKECLIVASNRRAKDIRRIIYCNISDDSAFVTLTYRDRTQVDEYKCKEDINFFIREINKYTRKKHKYIWVIERQRDGTVHFHIIFFNLHIWSMQYHSRDRLTIMKIWQIWGKGRTESVQAKTIINLARYLSNYTSKKKDKKYQRENLDGKCFACSRGLKRPEFFLKYDYSKSEKSLGHLVSRLVFPIRYSCEPCAICIYSLYTDRKQDLEEEENRKSFALERCNPKRYHVPEWEWNDFQEISESTEDSVRIPFSSSTPKDWWEKKEKEYFRTLYNWTSVN